jgi:hypothetical protein
MYTVVQNAFAVQHPRIYYPKIYNWFMVIKKSFIHCHINMIKDVLTCQSSSGSKTKKPIYFYHGGLQLVGT